MYRIRKQLPSHGTRSLVSRNRWNPYGLIMYNKVSILNIIITTIIISLILSSNVKLSLQQQMISLSGNDWHVRNVNGSISVAAIVPGGIYTDLRRANILKQDIFYGKNDMNYRWVGNENWTYTSTFAIDDNIARSQSVKLVAHGLDTASTLVVNGQIIGLSDNMFVRYKFDIKPYLRLAGLQNTLEIFFESPIKYGARKSHQSILNNRGKIIPPYCPSPAQRGECHVNFIRKMQASFSWDWGPAFPSVGIYKTIGIEYGDFGIIRDILVETKQAPPTSPPRSPVNLFVNPISNQQQSSLAPPQINNIFNNRDTINQKFNEAEKLESVIHKNQLYEMDENWLLKVTLVAEMSQPLRGYDMHIEFNLDNILHYESDHMNVVSNSEGVIRLGFNLRIDHNKIRIKTWWPNNAGNQPLYRLQARISQVAPKPPMPEHIRVYPTQDGGFQAKPMHQSRMDSPYDATGKERNLLQISEKSIKVGFRSVELIQEPVTRDDAELGLTFKFRINGIDLFAMGSNWIPSHILPEMGADKDYLRYLLKSAKDANMNMLRVWGGGLYESDEFYELADEMGIMIWHDLMFACALYPVDDAFLQSVRSEVEQQIQRLQHHPSIVLWAGNNENEVAISSPWWPEVVMWSKQLREMYSKMYVDTIRPIVQILDPTRPYLESSPTNGLMSQAQPNSISRTPNDNKYGDVHHYDYLSDSFDWTSYPSARFASEYGFQSYPSFGALAMITNSSDWKYPLTPNILHRQHRLSGEFEIKLQIKAHFNEVDSGGVDKFKSFIYLSQLTQAISIKTETEFYRRNRAISSQDNLGHTMGALYWQLNDVWQAPTWASIEFGGKWKMLHYFARRFFFPIHIVPYLINQPTNAFSAMQQVLSQSAAPQQFVVDLIRDDLFDKLSSFNVTIRLYRWSSFSAIWRDRVTVYATKPLNVTRIYENDLNRIYRLAGLVSGSAGIFQITLEQQPLIGLSQIENYLMPVIPARITGMRLPRIIIDQIQGPYESLSYNYPNSNYHESAPHPSNSNTFINWPCTYRLTLISDSIAMFVWLELNFNNLPPEKYATLLQSSNYNNVNGASSPQNDLPLDNTTDNIYKIHFKPIRYQFSDNAFNMFEPGKVIDLYLDRFMSKNLVESVLEITSMANNL